MTSYSGFVNKIKKPADKIKAELTVEDCDLLHMAIGISGEAGELLDAIKKATIYRQELDDENIIEELGDLLFYITGMANILEIPLWKIFDANRAKLSKRYPEMNYTDSNAISRADKASDDDDGA